MNNVLELKGKRFVQSDKPRGGFNIKMNSKAVVTSMVIDDLKQQIDNIIKFWETEDQPFSGVLISVHFNKILSKTNRIAGIFKGKSSNDAVVGAKFNEQRNCHIITYFLELQELKQTSLLLETTKNILDAHFEGAMDMTKFTNSEVNNKKFFLSSPLSMSKFKQVIADVSYIDYFEVEQVNSEFKQSIVTLYDVKENIKEVLKRVGIDILNNRILDNQTIHLDAGQLEILLSKAPYLVSMSTIDLSSFDAGDFLTHLNDEGIITVPSPQGNEPVIGVIDTLFDERTYFSEWVEYHELVSKDIPRTSDDYKHGTAVSSIIVDGPQLNPWLEDNCGRFKVRHFGVAAGKQFSSFTIIKQIKEIVMKNKDIKVWNISLGSNQEINDNFISAEAAILDQIQYDNDVIFVIAGTNKQSANVEKIGSPADSINSIVVNAVTRQGLSTRYARRGIVLSFFAKPDVSYYGGSSEQYMQVCEPNGAANVAGTSYAAPWIARKLSYLIDILGLNREVAKALIIDAARGWNPEPFPEEIALYGHGIVPIKIEDIIKTQNDEIKFVVSDISEKWNTYNYQFPVPLKDDKYPYIAKATMCYFPRCNRLQGVDYTNTELNLHFGRLNQHEKLKDIVGDKQNNSDNEPNYLLEDDARKMFRKWDNVKYVAEDATKKKRAKSSFGKKNWGMEIKTNNRLNPEDGHGIRFGVVVTLKEINGVNRIDDFIKSCTLNGWLVNQIDIHSRTEFHQKVNEEIEFT